MPAAVPSVRRQRSGVCLMADVMIGVDPHKSSHTAVAIGLAEERLGGLQVRACPSQAEQLLAWAAGWPERVWVIEGAAGLGHLLAQQLVAAGERVLDVPPKLAARVRLLQAGDTNKSAWPGGHPGGMKCSRRPAGRGRRLDTGALRVRNKSGAGPAGPGIVAASTNPRFG